MFKMSKQKLLVKKKQEGFSLIELLIVVTLLAIVVVMSSNTFILNGIDYQLLALPKQQKFGTIRFAQNSINTHKVVIKDISHPSQLHFLRNGGDKILCNINHPNLPKTESINWLSNEKAIIVREYFDGIDLKEIIATNNLYKKLSTATILSIFCQVLEALNYLHSLGVIHSDIKPSNILVNLDDASKPKVQLIDLEQAHLLDQTNHNYQKPFALIYSPPEQLLKQTYLHVFVQVQILHLCME